MQLHQQAEQAVSTCAVLFLWFNEEAVDCTGRNKASEWLFCVCIYNHNYCTTLELVAVLILL